ncbi:MAG: DUF58 domain-containing protein [Kangiellaceae bacterium]|nr:DUF58 domain-containing protein [Kangiellaceae bacterium]
MVVPKFIRNKFFTWVDSRIPQDGATELRQRNIYILPTRYGWLMLVILILILVASTNYQNNMGFMAGFILLAIGMLSTFYTYRNVRELKLRVLKPEPVFVDQEARFLIQIDNSGEQLRSTIGIGTQKKQVIYFDIPAKGKAMEYIPIKAVRRGVLLPKRFVCTSIYPFGIFQVWSWFKTQQPCLVYPKPIACPEILHMSSIGEEEGVVSQKGTEDFYALREYQTGDPIKQLMWKAYARERGLLTKEFEDKVGEHSLLTWQSVAHYEKELAISYLTDALLQAERAQQFYGLELPHKKINKGSGDQHLHHCLEALALMP